MQMHTKGICLSRSSNAINTCVPEVRILRPVQEHLFALLVSETEFWFLGICSLVPEALTLSEFLENGISVEPWKCSWKVIEKHLIWEVAERPTSMGKGRQE